MSNITDTNERDIAKIAEGLSEAQRRAIRCAIPQGKNLVNGGPAYWMGYGYNKPTGVILHSKGIAETPSRSFVLTPTGQAVRNHIMKDSPNA